MGDLHFEPFFLTSIVVGGGCRVVKSVLLSPTANCLGYLSLGSIATMLSKPNTQLLENAFRNIKTR